jgi:putative sigma-54 modulation protein
MNIAFTFKNFEPSDHLRKYAKRRFEKLGRFLLKSENVEMTVNLSVDKFRHKVEVQLAGNNLNLTAAEQSEDMYAIVDMLMDKLEAQIKKHSEKLKEKRRSASPAAPGSSPEAWGRSIIGEDKFVPKPMFLDEAAMQLEQLKDENLLSHFGRVKTSAFHAAASAFLFLYLRQLRCLWQYVVSTAFIRDFLIGEADIASFNCYSKSPASAGGAFTYALLLHFYFICRFADGQTGIKKVQAERIQDATDLVKASDFSFYSSSRLCVSLSSFSKRFWRGRRAVRRLPCPSRACRPFRQGRRDRAYSPCPPVRPRLPVREVRPF